MPSWDDIYQNFQRGGEAWATLSEGIDSRFQEFVQSQDFPIRNAFDIGCGTGKYLVYLQKLGFTVNGIDSSPTAVEMTQKATAQTDSIQLADMYTIAYPKETFDLVVSVSTLHHGQKDQIATTLHSIYQSLVPHGKGFITLPNWDAQHHWETFQDHTELAPGTFAPNIGPEAGIPHSFFTREEVTTLFEPFTTVSLELDEIGRWFITGEK